VQSKDHPTNSSPPLSATVPVAVPPLSMETRPLLFTTVPLAVPPLSISKRHGTSGTAGDGEGRAWHFLGTKL
jgi:hypothetical protein